MPELRALANRVEVIFHEPRATVAESRRVVAMVDRHGEVSTIPSVGLQYLQDWDVVRLRATGPEDSEWFLTDEMMELYGPLLEGLGGWKVVVPDLG